MAEVQRQILSVPAAQIVTNHVVGFYELAAIHLGQPEPDLDAARLAVDAMTAVLDAAGDRLGEDGAGPAPGARPSSRSPSSRPPGPEGTRPPRRARPRPDGRPGRVRRRGRAARSATTPPTSTTASRPTSTTGRHQLMPSPSGLPPTAYQ